ncbi:MAG: peptidoglycan-binding protein, partial [Oscillospiraceae bacterium]|nr:peptidoglycan-binding protein [Oscillospiraceae bacterium]
GAPENLGYQLMDAEIAGKLEVELQSNEPKMLWKRYTYSNAGEEMEYLQVSTYKNGQVENILFELESDVAPTPNPVEQYERLTRGDKSDAVRELQERLIELKYLSGKTGKADGNYGSKTQDAVRAAQKDFGMEETGTATPEFQMRLFSDNPLVDEDEAAAEDEAEDEAADEDAYEAEDAESVEKSESKKKSKN